MARGISAQFYMDSIAVMRGGRYVSTKGLLVDLFVPDHGNASADITLTIEDETGYTGTQKIDIKKMFLAEPFRMVLKDLSENNVFGAFRTVADALTTYDTKKRFEIVSGERRALVFMLGDMSVSVEH